MVIFLIGSLPLFYWSIQYFFNNENVRLQDQLRPFLFGVLAAVPAVLLYWALDVYFKLSWKPLRLFFYTFMNKEGLIYIPIILFLFFLYKPGKFRGIPLREFTGWLCGYYTLFGIMETMIYRDALSGYQLILLPVVRIITILSASVLLGRSLTETDRTRRVVFRIFLALLPLVLNAVPLTDLMNLKGVMYPLLCLFGAASVSAWYLESVGKLPV